MENSKEHCFVIMPFSQTTPEHSEDYWTKHFQLFLKPMIEKSGIFEANRAEALRGDILRQIISDLVISRVIVADLTDHNPNVFWELGVRQSFKHSTITIAEYGTKLPFDVGGKGTLFYYPKDHLKNEDFRNQFQKALEDCFNNPDRPDSHVLETLSGRGTLFEIFRKDEALRRVDALISECKNTFSVLNTMEKFATDNQKDKTKRSYPTARFRVSSLSLLVTNRYLDTQESFYKLAESCLSGFEMMNEQLNIWEHKPNSTEPWLIDQIPKKREVLTKVYEKILQLRESITSRL